MNYFNAGMYAMNMYQYMTDRTETYKNTASVQMTKTASVKNETFSEIVQRKNKQEESAVDRSVHNPWAAMPGYSPNYHTESFGASIEEHLGQSGPMGGMGRTGRRKTREDEEESWWVRRNKIMIERLKEATAEKAAQEKVTEKLGALAQ